MNLNTISLPRWAKPTKQSYIISTYIPPILSLYLCFTTSNVQCVLLTLAPHPHTPTSLELFTSANALGHSSNKGPDKAKSKAACISGIRPSPMGLTQLHLLQSLGGVAIYLFNFVIDIICWVRFIYFIHNLI
jgi:hypothetical protein